MNSVEEGPARAELENVDAVHDTHKRFFQLILAHGTPEERKSMADALITMREWRQAFPGSTWEPIEEVTLPSYLAPRALQVARQRVARARARGLRDQHGLERLLSREVRTTEAQYALCIMLGFGFDDVVTHTQAKSKGNIGHNCSAICPDEGNWGMIIQQDELPSRDLFLLYCVGPHRYELRGWMKASAGMERAWQKHFLRNEVHSRPWMPPNDLLRSLTEWFNLRAK